MGLQRIAGIVLVVVGIALFAIGLNASDSVGDRVSEFFTGRFTDKTVWYLVGGGAMFFLGLFLAAFNGKGRAA